MNVHEHDFQFAKALKTLQENTDPQNLIPSTKQLVANQDPLYLGALAIAQVWNSDPQAALRMISTRLAGASQHYDCRRSLFQTNAADSCPSLLFLRISSKVRLQLRASFFTSPLTALQLDRALRAAGHQRVGIQSHDFACCRASLHNTGCECDGDAIRKEGQEATGPKARPSGDAVEQGANRSSRP